jgi:hypothetical protein
MMRKKERRNMEEEERRGSGFPSTVEEEGLVSTELEGTQGRLE